MDLCVIDWSALGSILSAIATFFAGGVALWIFFQWRGQKGAEVIAIEAKQTIKNILDINRIFLFYEVGDSERIDDDQIRIIKVKHQEIISSCLYLEECVYIDGLTENMQASFILFKCLIEKFETSHTFDENDYKQINVGIKKIGEIHDDFVRILNPYSVYKINFKFNF